MTIMIHKYRNSSHLAKLLSANRRNQRGSLKKKQEWTIQKSPTHLGEQLWPCIHHPLFQNISIYTQKNYTGTNNQEKAEQIKNCFSNVGWVGGSSVEDKTHVEQQKAGRNADRQHPRLKLKIYPQTIKEGYLFSFLSPPLRTASTRLNTVPCSWWALLPDINSMQSCSF